MCLSPRTVPGIFANMKWYLVCISYFHPENAARAVGSPSPPPQNWDCCWKTLQYCYVHCGQKVVGSSPGTACGITEVPLRNVLFPLTAPRTLSSWQRTASLGELQHNYNVTAGLSYGIIPPLSVAYNELECCYVSLAHCGFRLLKIFPHSFDFGRFHK